MYFERHDHMSKGDLLAQQIVSVKQTLNGASNAMLVTPFFVAANRDQLIDHLEIFASDIKDAAATLIRVAKVDAVAFDSEASGRDVIAGMLLQDPNEERVRNVFDRARGEASNLLDGMKKTAKHESVIDVKKGEAAVMILSGLNNVVRGTQDFYRRVPAHASEGFFFR